MDNIIQFPSHLLEKERELAFKEIDLQIREHHVSCAERKVRENQVKHRAQCMAWFGVGVLVSLALVAVLSLQMI